MHQFPLYILPGVRPTEPVPRYFTSPVLALLAVPKRFKQGHIKSKKYLPNLYPFAPHFRLRSQKIYKKEV